MYVENMDTMQINQADTEILMRKRPFLSGIRLKLFLAMLLAALLMLVVGYINYVTAQHRFSVVDEISSTEISKLHTLQEVYSDIVIANVYSSKALDVTNKNIEEGTEFVRLYDEKIKDIDVFLSALMLGSESDEFLSLNGGEDARIWNEHVEESDNAITVVKKVHDEVVPMVSEARMHLTMYSQSFHKAFNAREEVFALQAQGDFVQADAVQIDVDKFEREALNEHIEPLSNALKHVEKVANEQVKEDVLSLQLAVNRSRLITVLTLVTGVILMFVIGFVFEYLYIAKPLETFALTIENMSTGDMTERVPVNSNDEIGRLAVLFNRMVDRTIEIYAIMEKKIEEKTASLSETLSKLESNNADLEKSQQATINLLEDIENEKAAVEQKVTDRTSELEREKSKLLQVTSNMRGGGILFDKERKVAFTNDAAGALLGVEKGKSNEEILDAFVSYFREGGIDSHLRSCFEGNTFSVNEIESGGKIYEMFFHALKHHSEEDECTDDCESIEGYFVLFFDITDIKSLEHSKSELVSVASHQLRTPLTAVRGNIEMLIDESFGKLNKEQHELLDDIEVSTKRLIVMVNDMLDITKIEKGDLDLHIEELNVKENIDSILVDLQVYAEKNSVVIDEREVADDVIIEGDRSRTRQIFQNLIDNGIKYGKHPGTLKISAQMKGDIAEIIFKDDGIGIPKEEFSKLFNRFYRASNTANVPVSGSGLGLYIVKSIAHQLGGDISFESEENVGTTFTVTLPRIYKKKQ